MYQWIATLLESVRRCLHLSVSELVRKFILFVPDLVSQVTRKLHKLHRDRDAWKG